MKVLRFLLILILILVVGYLVLCAVSAKEVNVERSTTINAPASVVWDQMVHFKNWDNWSPWKEMDSTIVNDYTGVDGEPGSTSHYVGKHSGEGTMTNIGVTGMKMTYDLHFIKPFEAMTTGSVRVEEKDGAVVATQSFHQDVPFMMRGASALMGGEKMITTSFDRGLELLKKYAEAHAADAGGNISIQEVQFPGYKYAAIRQTIGWGDMDKFFAEAYGKLGQAAGARIIGPASALYYTWDTAKHQTDVAATFPVSGTDAVSGATMIDVPAVSAYMVEYTGPYTGSMSVHESLGRHLGMMGKESSLVVEEYVVGPPAETDSNKYVTKIYYLLK